MTLAQWIVVAVALQRLAELGYGRRNEARLRAAGAIEIGAGHYPLLVLVHAAWLLALFAAAESTEVVSWPLLAIYGGLQVGRLWVIATLGRFWTTRILTLPHTPLVARGPYRLCRHPNYVIVAAEIACLPLAFGAWRESLIFTLLNAAILGWRIRVEERALAGRRGAASGAAGKTACIGPAQG